jgi:hypothetical protein
MCSGAQVVPLIHKRERACGPPGMACQKVAVPGSDPAPGRALVAGESAQSTTT